MDWVATGHLLHLVYQNWVHTGRSHAGRDEGGRHHVHGTSMVMGVVLCDKVGMCWVGLVHSWVLDDAEREGSRVDHSCWGGV